MRTNNEIREWARQNSIPLWKIADCLGISEATFFRWLRKPLDSGKQASVLSVIDKLKAEVREGV